MSLPPQKFREMVFQMLYSSESTENAEEKDLIAMMMGELKVTRRLAKEAYDFVQAIQAHRAEIDARIGAASRDYEFERISSVEKNLLRLAVFELFYKEGLCPAIVIAEAIRLCRKFGTPSSAQFVNAVLQEICPLNPASDPVSC